MRRKTSYVVILLCIVLVGSVGAYALDFSRLHRSPNTLQNTTPIDPETFVRGLTVFQDDTYSDHDDKNIPLTFAEKHQATVWGLKPEEEKRYVELMQNRSGQYWKTARLSPVEILGINARGSSERKRFAHLYAKQLQAKLAKELAWQFSVSLAKRAVNTGLPLIRAFDVRPFSPYNFHAVQLQSEDQLFLFTREDLQVRHVVGTLLLALQAHPTVTLHIYFSGRVRARRIQDWAKHQNIPVSLVKKHRITLNTHAGPFKKIKGNKKLPWLILVRGGRATRMDLSRF